MRKKRQKIESDVGRFIPHEDEKIVPPCFHLPSNMFTASMLFNASRAAANYAMASAASRTLEAAYKYAFPDVKKRKTLVLSDVSDAFATNAVSVPDQDEFEILTGAVSTLYCSYVQTLYPTPMTWTHVVAVTNNDADDSFVVEIALFNGELKTFEEVSSALPHWKCDRPIVIYPKSYGKSYSPPLPCDHSTTRTVNCMTTTVMPFMVAGRSFSTILKFDNLSRARMTIVVGDHRPAMSASPYSTDDLPRSITLHEEEIGCWWYAFAPVPLPALAPYDPMIT